MDSRKVMVVSSSTHKPVRRWLPLPGCRQHQHMLQLPCHRQQLPLPGCRRHQYVLQFPCRRRQLPTARPTLPRCHPRDPCLRSLVCASPSGLQFNSGWISVMHNAVSLASRVNTPHFCKCSSKFTDKREKHSMTCRIRYEHASMKI